MLAPATDPYECRLGVCCYIPALSIDERHDIRIVLLPPADGKRDARPLRRRLDRMLRREWSLGPSVSYPRNRSCIAGFGLVNWSASLFRRYIVHAMKQKMGNPNTGRAIRKDKCLSSNYCFFLCRSPKHNTSKKCQRVDIRRAPMN